MSSVKPTRTELAGGAVVAAVHLAAQDEACTEAGADREKDEVVDAARDAAPPLAERRQVDVVLDVGLRPESLDLAADGIPAEVEVVEELGADSYVFVDAEIGKLVARVETKLAPERGARISLRPRAGEAHLFDPATGARLSG